MPEAVGLVSLLELAQPYGIGGLFVAYFAWRDWRRDQREEKREERRAELEQKRIDADLEVARGYAMLATKLEVLSNVRSL